VGPQTQQAPTCTISGTHTAAPTLRSVTQAARTQFKFVTSMKRMTRPLLCSLTSYTTRRLSATGNVPSLHNVCSILLSAIRNVVVHHNGMVKLIYYTTSNCLLIMIQLSVLQYHSIDLARCLLLRYTPSTAFHCTVLCPTILVRHHQTMLLAYNTSFLLLFIKNNQSSLPLRHENRPVFPFLPFDGASITLHNSLTKQMSYNQILCSIEESSKHSFVPSNTSHQRIHLNFKAPIVILHYQIPHLQL